LSATFVPGLFVADGFTGATGLIDATSNAGLDAAASAGDGDGACDWPAPVILAPITIEVVTTAVRSTVRKHALMTFLGRDLATTGLL